MTQLICPNCNQALNVKNLTFSGDATVGQPSQIARCPSCNQNSYAQAWIANTPNSFDPATYFFRGPGKKNKWIKLGGMKLAEQAGPGTGTGQAAGWRIRSFLTPQQQQDSRDVFIHIIDDDVTLVGERFGSRGKFVVILCGSGNDLVHFGINDLVSGYDRLGHRCLAVDYRGYGDSTGNTTKQGIYADARAMVGFLEDRMGAGIGDIFIHGWSIGSAPAVEVVKTFETLGTPFGGMILQCPISSTYSAARAHGENPVKAYIGKKMMAMDNLEKVRGLRTPTLILKGLQDDAGFQAMADALHAKFPPGVSTLAAFNGGHFDHKAPFSNCGGQISRLMA